MAVLLAPAPALAKVVWRGDFETGNIKQWTRAQMVSSDRLQVVSSPVRQGKKALRVRVKQGDDPISSSGNRNELVQITDEPANSEYWYGWSTMFDKSFPSANAWQLFVQWHHRGSSGSPPVEILVRGEKMEMRANRKTIWTAPLVRGKWRDFVLHVKWSSNAKVGFVEMWLDGKLVLPKTYAATQYSGMRNYLKMGLYRDSKVKPDGILFHDGFVMGTTRADVTSSSTTASTAAKGLMPFGGSDWDVGHDGFDPGPMSSWEDLLIPDVVHGSVMDEGTPTHMDDRWETVEALPTVEELASQLAANEPGATLDAEALDGQVGCSMAGASGAMLPGLLGLLALGLRRRQRRR